MSGRISAELFIESSSIYSKSGKKKKKEKKKKNEEQFDRHRKKEQRFPLDRDKNKSSSLGLGLGLGLERNGGLGPEHEIDTDPNPSANDESRAKRRCGLDAEAEGGVQVPHRLHTDEQVQRQRLVPDLRVQSGGDTLDRQVLVRAQSPQVRVRPPIRYPCHLSLHSSRARAPSTRWQDPKGFIYCLIPILSLFVYVNFHCSEFFVWWFFRCIEGGRSA